MVSKASVIHAIRNILAIMGSFILISETYAKFDGDFIKGAFVAVAILWASLVLVDFILFAARKESINYFYANTMLQFIPNIILIILGLSKPILFLIGLLLLVSNIIMIKILAMQKKTIAKKENSLSKANKVLQYLRDISLFIVSLVLMASSYGKWVEEPAHYILFALAGLIMLLSLINILLILVKVKSRGYFYFNSIIQMVFALLFIGLGPTMPVGLILIVLNIIILITLRRKKVK